MHVTFAIRTASSPIVCSFRCPLSLVATLVACVFRVCRFETHRCTRDVWKKTKNVHPTYAYLHSRARTRTSNHRWGESWPRDGRRRCARTSRCEREHERARSYVRPYVNVRSVCVCVCIRVYVVWRAYESCVCVCVFVRAHGANYIPERSPPSVATQAGRHAAHRRRRRRRRTYT